MSKSLNSYSYYDNYKDLPEREKQAFSLGLVTQFQQDHPQHTIVFNNLLRQATKNVLGSKITGKGIISLSGDECLKRWDEFLILFNNYQQITEAK